MFTRPKLMYIRQITYLRVAFVLLIIFGPGGHLYAQQASRGQSMSMKANYGQSMTSKSHQGTSYAYGLTAAYEKEVAGLDQEWVRVLNAQRMSLGGFWQNLNHIQEDISGILYPNGQAFGLFTSLEMQLFKLDKVSFSLTPSLGLAYITETIETQPATATVGSHFNVYLMGTFGADVPLGQRLSLLAEVNVNHMSNGGMKVPNGGINTFNGVLGLRSKLVTPTSYRAAKSEIIHQLGSGAEVSVGMGIRGKYRSGESFYRTGIYAGYNYVLNQAIGFRAGMDMVYYHSVFDIDRFDETFQYYGSSYDRIRAGIGVGMDVGMGRFAFNALLGKYLHFRSFHENVNWYWTSGIRYYFTGNIAIQSTLYMHRVQADYVNWGLVFKI